MIGKVVLDNSSLNCLFHQEKYSVGISGERKICQRFLCHDVELVPI